MKARGVKLGTTYGATEFGAIAMSNMNSSDEEDWEYMEFSPEHNIRLAPQGDGTFECQVLVSYMFHVIKTHY